MRFFIPAAKDVQQAEEVYASVAKFNDAPLDGRRICAIAWTHNGMQMSCEVGSSLPAYYGTRDELVVAIFDCGYLFKVCTASRGVVRGEAVLVGKGEETWPTYFDA